MADATATWVATLSDGSTAVEESGQWTTNPGERKPWVRLCDFAQSSGLYLTSLRLNYDGTTIHLPREKFGRFGLEDHVLTPTHYSLSYCIEAELGDDGAFGNERLFVNLSAHFEGDLAVNYIQQITGQDNSWIVLSKGGSRMAESPRKLIGPEQSDAQIDVPAE